MHSQINTKRLFLASRVALVATAMTFAIRANLMGPLGEMFHITPEQMGWVVGTAFWGFTLSMIFGGLLCDWLGMKALVGIAFVSHLLGTGLTLMASGFWSLFISTLLIGIANGMVEAVCNPLVATLYPNEKTTRLNQFHVWFPGGIVIGGLLAFALKEIGVGWQGQLAMIFIPTLVYGYLFWNQSFPPTERVRSGVSTWEMVKECRRPLFLLIVFCFLLSAATELGTNQWITELLSNVGVPSILLLVFINGIMAIGRANAGFIEHRMSSVGMLLFSSVFSAIGLVSLSQVSGPASFVAAAVFAVGICFFWPTMLGFVSEYLPRTGALGLSISSGAGMLSVSLLLPVIGKVYEHETAAQLNYLSSKSDDLGLPLDQAAKLAGGAATLLYVALMPFLLAVVFLVLFLARKHLKKEQLTEKSDAFRPA